MWGAAACAFSASMLSHFSTTMKASGPSLVWNGRAFSASTTGPYSMQPFSARTAARLARACLRISSRLPGLAVMRATTWTIARLPLLVVRSLLGDARVGTALVVQVLVILLGLRILRVLVACLRIAARAPAIGAWIRLLRLA